MNPTPITIRITVWAWLIIALVAGNSRWLERLPMPATQGILLLLTAAVLLLYFTVKSLRSWLDSLDLRALVMLHVTRFVGIYFLLLYQRGELPYEFAVRGGWGDIVVAILALVVCALPLAEATRRRAIYIWNVIGFIDIVLVVYTAAKFGWRDPWQVRALTYLPLSLLPTFLVPLIIATHVIIFHRLRRDATPAQA